MFFPFSGTLLFGVLLVLTAYWLARPLRRRYLARRYEKEWARTHLAYADFLKQRNPYYRSLDAEQQDRFLYRLILFMDSRQFEFVGIEASEQLSARLLISSAAIQLTFGLDDFMLDPFRSICVLPNRYRYRDAEAPFEGNLASEGIYLSWPDVVREFSNYGDGENVALHEMAHALLVSHRGQADDAFTGRFAAFSATARPVIESMQQGGSAFLNSYAATNSEEFWAVCVENFFERPFPFREQLPDLYAAICRVLNQDPAVPDRSTAG